MKVIVGLLTGLYVFFVVAQTDTSGAGATGTGTPIYGSHAATNLDKDANDINGGTTRSMGSTPDSVKSPKREVSGSSTTKGTGNKSDTDVDD